MASPPATNGGVSSSPIDTLFLQNLMSRLQLRPPYLESNSFLTHSLDDLLLLSSSLSEPGSDADSDPEPDSPNSDTRHRSLAKEEAKLEKEIIRIIHSGGASDLLKPNSGQSVPIGDHNICVGFHMDKESEYRVWEWHGHVMLFDEEEGYSAEYIYGNYFERLVGANKGKSKKDEESSSGLRDLIGAERPGGRVVHRNSINSSSINGSVLG